MARVETSLKKSAGSTEKRWKQTARTTENTFRSANRDANAFAGNGLRNVSLQLSQVSQQAMATGDPIRALAIQLPDMAVGLGTVGILAGVAAGALLPLVANLFSVGDSTADAETSLKSFEAAMAEVVKFSKIAKTDIKELREEFGDFAEAVQSAAELGVQTALSKAMESFKTATIDAQGEIANLISKLEDLESANAELSEQKLFGNETTILVARGQVDELIQEVVSLSHKLGVSSANARDLQDALEAVASANGPEEIAQSASDAIEYIKGMYDETQNIPPEMALIVDNLNLVLTAAAAGADAIAGMGDSAADAVTQVERLARAFQYATAAGQNTVTGFESDDPRSKGAGALDTRFEYGRVSPFAASRQRKPKKRRGGSKGKSEAEKETNRLLRERDRILRSLETAQDKYNREVSELEELQKRGMLTTEEYQAAIANLQVELANAEFGEVISGIETISNSLADAIVNGENLADTFKQILKRMVADLIASNIQNLLMRTFSIGGTRRGGGFLGSILGGVFGGRSGGGSVNAGNIYPVNENTPNTEYFMPSTSGKILTPSQANIGGGAASPAYARVELVGGPLKLTDKGEVATFVTLKSDQSRASAVSEVRQNLQGWQGQLRQDGALI